MRTKFKGNWLHVHRENGDPKYYGIQNAAGESKLLYALKKHLNAQGFDLIKKRMWKDGHLKDDIQQYLRARKPTGNPEKDIMIHNANWQIAGAEEDYNKGMVKLAVVYNCFKN